MYALLIPITCQPCGAEFSLVNAWDGACVQCPRCQRMLTIRLQPAPRVQEQPALPGLGETVVKIGLAALAVGVLFKIGQAISDEDFGDGEFPQRFRDERRAAHVAEHGYRCSRCRRGVRYEDLTVDHIVSLKNGGRTSRANADVLCRRCNSSKGATNSLFDFIRGRSI